MLLRIRAATCRVASGTRDRVNTELGCWPHRRAYGKLGLASEENAVPPYPTLGVVRATS
jgi:hypothetical protein